MTTPSGKTPAEIRLTQLLWRAFFGGLAVWLCTLWLVWYFAIDNKTALHALTVNIGTAGLTIAVGGVLGGFVKGLFDKIEAERETQKARTEKARAKRADDIAFMRNVLNDFKRVYDIVEHARLLIDAHKSAKTYGEQIRSLPDAIIILHNIRRALDHKTGAPLPEVLDPIAAMIAFLKGLTSEFQLRYIDVSRLQSQDEANNRYLREQAARGDQKAPKGVTQMAWDEIKGFTCLKALRHDCPYIAQDVTDREIAALMSEAAEGNWFAPGELEQVLEEKRAFTLLRRKYEVLFLDHIDTVSRDLRARISAEMAKDLDTADNA